ncbi:MAG: CotH kinase family protein [Tenericutes bacterium]|nr:CotH kinase family protein [Mycoplasmatota bacterium]
MKKVLFILLVTFILITLGACDYVLVPNNPQDTLQDDFLSPDAFNIEPFDRLFNDDVAKSITIKITSNAWDELDQSMIDYQQQFGSYRAGLYVRADMVYEDELGTVEINDVGLRTRGNLSRVRIQDDSGNLNPSHFKISFDEDFGFASLLENGNRSAFELEEIDLKYNRNMDATYLTEKFSMDLFNEFGVYAQKTTLTKLFIQIDETTHFYGLYTAFEPIDKKFVERRLDDIETNGNLYKSLWQQFGPASLQNNYPQEAIGIRDIETNYRPTYDLKTNKRTNDTSDLVYFIEHINTLDDQAFKTYIESSFDVDRFIRLLAVGVLLGNPDDYRAMGNNYYLYNQPTSNVWTMIPYDYDHGLAQGWDGSPIFSNWTVGADIYTWGNLNAHMLGIANYAHPLVDRILNIEDYQLLYESYLETLINPENHLFSYHAFSQLFQQQKLLYDEDLDEAMVNLRFDLRNIEWYIDAKVNDISNQLIYYQQNPTKRGN